MRRLFVLPLLLLAACGDVAPTATPSAPVTVPATAAPAATALPVPTNTTAVAPTSAPSLPPTATTAPVPPTDTAIPPSPTVAATAAVSVTQFTSYIDAINNVVVIGAVKNIGTARVSNIQVTASAESGGNVVATGSDYLLALVSLAPGEVGPFQISLSPAPPKGATIQIQAQSTAYDPKGFNIFVPAQGLTVSGTALTAGNIFGSYSLTGKVTNGGTATTELISIVAVGYDSAGKVVDVGKGGPNVTTLAAGQSSPFKVDFQHKGAKIVKTDVVAVGSEKH